MSGLDRARPVLRVTGKLLFAGGLAILAAGFWFHTSGQGAVVFGKYSLRYALLAAFLTILVFVTGAYARVLFREASEVRGARAVPLTLVFKLLVPAVLLAVAIPIVELRLARAEERQLAAHQGQVSFHPFLQAVPKKNDDRLQINRWGFRGEEIDRIKPPGTYRIFVLGGSTVYSGRTPFESSGARLLEKKLRALYPRTRIEVQNAGMHWFTSQHSLIRFLSKIQDFDPDLVIFYHAVNDLCRSFSPPGYASGAFEADYAHFYGPVARMVDSFSGKERALNLHTIEKLREIFTTYWFSDLRKPPPLTAVQVSDWKSHRAFERNMRDLVHVIRARGIDVILASQPFLYKQEMTEQERGVLWLTDTFCRNAETKPDIDSMIAGMELYNKTSVAIAAEAGVPVVDLESRIPKTLEYFLDDVHYTESGNELIADALTESIVALGLVDGTSEAQAIHTVF